MRIAQIAPIVESLPPKKYGGTERVIYHLTEELIRRGHEVTLFASGDSKTSARLMPVVPKALRGLPDEKDIYGFNVHSLLNMGLAYSMQDEFDVIHDHGAHMGLPTANIARTPVVMTWHGPYDGTMRRYFSTLSRPNFVSISRAQARLAPEISFVGTVYNGLPMEHYPFGRRPKEYLLFVGRIDPEKGVHLAMDAAVALGRPLVIAAKLDDMVPHLRQYFVRQIQPRLRRHPELLQWVGEVGEEERNALMKDAYCFLHPVTWPEPFGLTLIEAMACGCPVVALNRGSIPEIIRDSETGFVVENLKGMIEAIQCVDVIDRAACRAYALLNFSAARMTDGYEAVYRHAIEMKATGNELHTLKPDRIPKGYARRASQQP